MSENVEVVRRQFEAFDHGGLEQGAEFWHPEIDWRAVEGALDDVGVLRGREAMKRYYQDWADTVEDIRTVIDEVLFDAGELLVVALRVEGRGRGSSVPASGRYFVAYTIRDDLIVSGREYATAEEALAAVS